MMTSGCERIVLVTSDEVFARTMEKQLGDNGYDVTTAGTMVAGLTAARRIMPSLVMLDRRQRDIGELRREPNLRTVPFVALQPPGQPCDEEECLKDLERDVDMVLCNQGYREVLARVRAVLRREKAAAVPKLAYQVGGLHMDIDRYEVTVDGRFVDLTPKEFRILQQLVSAPSRVFSRDELLNRIWGEDCALEEHTLDVHIHSLRHKIEADPSQPRVIVTVRGVGYKLKVP
jgi:DNA-binding response OmpR family regulator